MTERLYKRILRKQRFFFSPIYRRVNAWGRVGWFVVLSILYLDSFPLFAQEEEGSQKMRKWLPRTYAKSVKREPIRIAVLGDSISESKTYKNKTGSHAIFHGVFAHELAKHFFYTGGIRIYKPRHGYPEKLHNHVGPEIIIENHAKDGAKIYQALQELSSSVLENDPDLVLIGYGINDANERVSLEDYGKGIEKAIQMARSKGADVLVFGPTIILGDGKDKRGGLALTRPYARKAGEIAAKQQVYFIDLGAAMVQGEWEEDIALEEIPQTMLQRLADYFAHEKGIQDFVHPTVEAHQPIGKAVYTRLIHEEPTQKYTTKGEIYLHNNQTATLKLHIENNTEQERKGVLLPLVLARDFYPDVETLPFTIKPGKSKTISIGYKNKNPQTLPLLAQQQIWVSFLLSDAESYGLVECSAPVFPLQIKWNKGLFDPVSKQIEIVCQPFAPKHQGEKLQYTFAWKGQKKEGKFLLGNGAALKFPFSLPQKEGERQFSEIMRAQFTLQNQTYTYHQRIVGSQHLFLGEKREMLPLRQKKAWEKITFRAEADPQRLYLIYDIEGVEFEEIEEHPFLVLDLFIDARAPEHLRKFGFVGIVSIAVHGQEGIARVRRVDKAAFGDGYTEKVDAQSIKADLMTIREGGHRLTVSIPRKEFSLQKEDGEKAFIGLNSRLTLMELTEKGQPIYSKRYDLVPPNSLKRNDPRSLGVLVLSSQRSPQWSVWVTEN